MLLSLFLTCFVALGMGTLGLLLWGNRLKVASRLLGLLLAGAVVLAAGEVVALAWHVPRQYVEAGMVFTGALDLLVVAARPQWNPIGQVFFGTFVSSALAYLVFAGWVTAMGGLSPLGMLASAVLMAFELLALVLASSFAFESCDVLCRVKRSRPRPRFDPDHRPFVSLHIAAYNEPPDMLIQTIESVLRLDYPDFELIVIDNNTKDPAVWRPVERHCKSRDRCKFGHVDDWPGYKSGALNLVLRQYVDPRAEIVGVIDADYLVEPDFLTRMVGYFADPTIAYVQAPQDYREWKGDAYLTACYDAYKYFFTTTMPSRNQRNSIIFAGTMGLVRRRILDDLGGWDEWTITEDAELSLRMLRAGYSGLYVNESFGRGIMPLTFAAFKSQRFRWCFGSMQILRKHRRSLMPWNRDPDNHLSLVQRVDYFLGAVQWMNDLAYLAFSVILIATALLLLGTRHIALRPLIGATVLLPSALIASGLLRAVWALRIREGIGLRRSILAFLNWLSVSWTVALACIQGLTRRQGVFLRTPKTGERRNVFAGLWVARTETLLAVVLWGLAALVAARGVGRAFILALLAYQGSVYAAGPFMSWMNQHTELSAQLERRRRSELRRERQASRRPFYVGLAAAILGMAVIGAVFAAGGASPGTQSANPFSVPHNGPGSLFGGNAPPATPVPTVSPTVTPTPSPTVSPTPIPTTAPPTPTLSPTP